MPAALGADDYGTLALMLGVATVASSALALGGPAAVSLLVGAAPAERRIAVARALALRGLAWRELAVVVALAVALAAGAPANAALLLGLAAALDGAATTATQATLAAGQPWGFSLRWPVQNCALVVAALALQPASAASAAATLALATAAAAAFAAAVALRSLRVATDDLHHMRDVWRSTAEGVAGAGSLAWRLGLAGGLQQLQQRGAIPVAAALGVSSAQTGNVAIAVGAAVALTLAVVQLFQIELPGAARRVAAGHHALVRDRATRLALGSVGAGGALALAGVLAGPGLIDWLLGHEFSDAAGALGPALAAVPLAPVAALGVNHALLAGQVDVRIGLSAAGAVAFGIVAVLLLSSGSDAYDVALATIAGAAAAAGAAAFYARPPAALCGAAAGSAALVWLVGALVS